MYIRKKWYIKIDNLQMKWYSIAKEALSFVVFNFGFLK